MAKRGWVASIVLLALAGCSAASDEESQALGMSNASPTLSTTRSALSLPGSRRIVVFKSDTLPSDAAARIARSGATLRKSIDAIGVATIDADSVSAARLAADSSIAAVGAERSWKLSPGHVIGSTRKPPRKTPAPSDEYWGMQWDQRRINVQEAWRNVSARAQSKVTVAVLDVGVMTDHPDLDGQVIDGVDTNYAKKNDCVDPLHSPPGYPTYTTRINLETGAPCEATELDFSTVQPHGTHVAAIIAAKRGESGIVGVGPSLKIAAYKVFDRVHKPGAPFDDFEAYDGSVFEAIADAVQKRYPVVNLSFGEMIDRTNPTDDASWRAWNRVATLATLRGTLLVGAAGNFATNLNGPVAYVPADLPAVLAVSATASSKLIGPFSFGDDENPPVYGPIEPAPGSDILADYSNYGAAIDIAAPGGSCGPNVDPETGDGCETQYLITSAYPIYDPFIGGIVPVWGWMSGTSQASPHVAGVAALVKAKYPALGPLGIRARLQATANRIGPSNWFGAGLVDAGRATR